MIARMTRKTHGASLIWTIVVVVALCVVAAVCVWRYYEEPAQEKAQKFDRVFALVVRGMTSEEVKAAMGQPHAIRQGQSVTLTSMAWNNQGYGQGNLCDFEYVYRVRTILGTIEWIIGFDNEGGVIAKHRLD